MDIKAKCSIDAPDQSWLIRAVEEKPAQGIYEAAFAHMRKIARDQGIHKAIAEHDVDVLLAPMDSPVCSLSTASGKSPFSNPVCVCFC
jgi:hypothetical protein